MSHQRQYRPLQAQIANDIRSVLSERRHGLFEAKTGEGKTMVLLMEAHRYAETNPSSVKRVLIATSSRELQNQMLKEAVSIGLGSSTVTLKGIDSYVCLAKLHSGPAPLPMIEWAQEAAGDLRHPAAPVDASDYAEDHAGCLGDDCDYAASCFYRKAKEAALADATRVVIVSHTALATHLRMQAWKHGEGYLPPVAAIFIDEIHELADHALLAFRRQVEPQRIAVQADAYANGSYKDWKLSKPAKTILRRLERCALAVQKVLDDKLGRRQQLVLYSPTRFTPPRQDRINGQVWEQARELQNALVGTLAALAAPKLKAEVRRVTPLRQAMKRWALDIQSLEAFACRAAKTGEERALMLLGTQALALQSSPLPRQGRKTYPVLVRQPTWVGGLLKKYLMQGSVPVIGVSGTLRTPTRGLLSDDAAAYDYIIHEIGGYGDFRRGIESTVFRRSYPASFTPVVKLFLADSSFPPVHQGSIRDAQDEDCAMDLDAQLIYSLPTTEWLSETVGLLEKLARDSGGIYFLCTSTAAMEAIADRLQCVPDFKRTVVLERAGQTAGPRQLLRDHPDQYLVLSASGWTGVDIPSVRHLLIHRIPFHVVNLDLYNAADRGLAYATRMLPKAAIRLLQAIGRGIRGEQDICDIYILDSRIQKYKGTLLNITPSDTPGPGGYLWPTTKIFSLYPAIPYPYQTPSGTSRQTI